MRRHRPVMSTFKRNITEDAVGAGCIGNPRGPAGGGGLRGGLGVMQPIAQVTMRPWPAAYWTMGASAWLPASSGPQPMGTAVWVVWTGGPTGTRRYAGSSVAEPVTITGQTFGGPTGVMVTVTPVLGYMSNPSVTPIAAAPAPVRVPSMHPWSPYWEAGAYEAFSGQKPQCPAGSVARADGGNWYCVAAPMPNQHKPSASDRITERGSKKMFASISRALNPMNSAIVRAIVGPKKDHEITHQTLQHIARNPAHAVGDEWWEYSYDLDSPYYGSNGNSLWTDLMAVSWPGFTLAHTGDIQLHQYFGGIVGKVRAHVSGQSNGQWYNCVYTYSDGEWQSQSCVAQPSVPGGGMSLQHTGGGYATPQPPPYVPYRGGILQRLVNRLRAR